jgi:glucose-6-phosphate 1-dehydrogenase
MGLAEDGHIGKDFNIIGVARTELNDKQFQQLIKKATGTKSPTFNEITGRAKYVTGEYTSDSTFNKLKEIFASYKQEPNVCYYLATIPEMFGEVALQLKNFGLSKPTGSNFIRLVIEKPFGRSFESAEKLNGSLHNAFDENQIFRIDHYMGKENVQNLLALRFANAIFEPIWNRRYVDNIQLTVAESLGVEHRGGFYESEGALRDIVQNHVMQVLSLTLMEPPAFMDADSIRNEKVKLLHSVEVMNRTEIAQNVVRGQYIAGIIDKTKAVAYRNEPGVSKSSTTETFVAMRLSVDNWRWAGVPIYVRTGKRLKCRATELALQFKRVPHMSFSQELTHDLEPDILILRIQPDEGVSVRFGVKVPGREFKLKTVSMDFNYKDEFKEQPKDAYQRLILDALLGDPTLFIRSDEVMQAWKIITPIENAFKHNIVPLTSYKSGTFGPVESDKLLAQLRHKWHLT